MIEIGPNLADMLESVGIALAVALAIFAMAKYS